MADAGPVRLGSEKPAGGVELFSWVFMRVSGVALLLLALGHFFIMHFQHGVDRIDYDFVARRWSLFLWRGYDLAMLCLAMIHGSNGLRIVLDDYVRPPAARRWAVRGLYVLTVALLLLGTWAVIFFKQG